MKIEVHKVSKFSLFKLLVLGIGCSFFFLFLVFGVAALMGSETVRFENQAITGFKGLLTAMLMWPVFSLIFSSFIWCLCSFGLWVYSFFGNLNLKFKIVETSGETTV